MLLLSPQWGSSRPAVAVRSQQQQKVTARQPPPFRAPIHQPVAEFRFWHDEKRFRGSGDDSLAQHTLLAAGGIRMGGNPKAAPQQGLMGWQVAADGSWDILWSTSDGAHKAAPLINPSAGQLINALPGLEGLTRKRNLALTLQAAYGDDAWAFVPRTYSLPAQLLQWRQRLNDEAAQLAAAAAAAGTAAASTASDDTTTSSSSSSRQDAGQSGSHPASSKQAAAAADSAAAGADMGQITGWWALKTGQHLGQGLQVVPSSCALSAMLERNAPHIQQAAAAAGAAAGQLQVQQQQQGQEEQPETGSGARNAGSTSAAAAAAAGSTDTRNPPRPFISVQQYITQPLLINQRKFGLRVWVLAVGPKPYRAYVYQQGLVLFSSQPYNPDLAAVQAQGAASQGHLTNAALWGPEGGQHSSGSSGSIGGSIHGDSSSSSSGSAGGAPSDPAQQPVWSLQQLFELLGQQQAQHVWQQILDTTGKVMAAGAGPVADAAQELKWGGDAAFELLGFDFLLDSSYKPWLLEVNASPSMAWDTPDQPGASQLMYSIKQQMLLDMFALLRLQDRYPPPQQPAWDAAVGGKQAPRLLADRGLNPVLLQAASDAYFNSRPKVAAMVAADARQLAAAVAAAPTRQEVEAAVARLLQQLETAAQGGGGAQQQQQRQQVAGVLRAHMRQLVQVECELRSAGGWQSLLPHMPSRRDAAKQGWCLHASGADAAVASWLRLWQQMAPAAEGAAVT